MNINNFREFDKVRALENLYNTNKNRKINFFNIKFLILFLIFLLMLILILIFVLFFGGMYEI